MLAALNRIVEEEWRTSRRVYGGGLFKVEPRELCALAADALVEAFPDLGRTGTGQMRLELRSGWRNLRKRRQPNLCAGRGTPPRPHPCREHATSGTHTIAPEIPPAVDSAANHIPSEMETAA